MNWTGLAALVWDPSGGDDQQHDYPMIRSLIEQGNGPALDVGCGTGRLLLRYLSAGLDVDGIDTSPDMLAICREKAAKRGLKAPTLYEGAMQKLDLPRRYKTIYIPCGTYCLVTDRDEAIEALRRFYDHLEPGGTLVFNLFWQFVSHHPVADNATPDEKWHEMYTTSMPDGREMRQHIRLMKFDRVEQVFIAERRYRLYEKDQLVAEEVFPSNERWYSKYEMLMMLEKAGFHDLEAKADWTDRDFAEGDEVVVYIARK